MPQKHKQQSTNDRKPRQVAITTAWLLAKSIYWTASRTSLTSTNIWTWGPVLKIAEFPFSRRPKTKLFPDQTGRDSTRTVRLDGSCAGPRTPPSVTFAVFPTWVCVCVRIYWVFICAGFCVCEQKRDILIMSGEIWCVCVWKKGKRRGELEICVFIIKYYKV